MCFCVFFCKQKTAYDMRISDWSSDVCSSDLIDEVVGKHRETERKLEEALAENARLKNSQKQEDKPTQEVKPDDGPSPDDKNEDGSDKYPLGEFDKNYIKDVINHAYDQKAKTEASAQAEQARLQAERSEMGRSEEHTSESSH